MVEVVWEAGCLGSLLELEGGRVGLVGGEWQQLPLRSSSSSSVLNVPCVMLRNVNVRPLAQCLVQQQHEDLLTPRAGTTSSFFAQQVLWRFSATLYNLFILLKLRWILLP